MGQTNPRYLLAEEMDSPSNVRRSRLSTLPEPLLRLVPKRLRALALIWAFFYALVLAIRAAVELAEVGDSWPVGVHATFGLVVVASLGVVALVRRYRQRPHILQKIGLIYEVIGALALAAAENQAPYAYTDAFRPGVSWVAIWIIIYPLMVPSRTLHTLISSAASWLSLPLTLALFTSLELTDPNPGVYVGYAVTGSLVVVLTIIPQRFVFRMGRTVQQLRQMGAYKLERLIGRGGMGEVWLARHRMLARPAAVKLIRPEVEECGDAASIARAMARFEQEAQSTAALRSPHTVQLYDFGSSQDGQFYYVMEHLSGIDLDRLVSRFGAQRPERTVAILEQACASLREAHEVGLVHRDIKPANLMLCRYGVELDFVKVLDFGMVKRTTAPTDTEPGLTQEGAITGTPAFVAPEIITGELQVSGAADIYALGCVGYWLLTGELVFEAASATAMVVKHVSEEPVAPSQRTELEIPAELDRIILRCLAKNPKDRFADACALAAALDEIPLAQPWSEARARRWWDTHLPDLDDTHVNTPRGEDQRSQRA